jgi:hypothetical protein
MKRIFGKAFSLALILVMVLATGALADQVGADSDITTPGNQNSVTLTANAGAIVTTTAGLAVEWSGSRHLNPGDALKLVISSSDLPSGYSVSPVNTSVPSDWDDDPGIFYAGDSNITFTAPSIAGSYIYTLKWDNNDNDACVDETKDCVTSGAAYTINLTVNATAADTTAPVISYTVNGIYPPLPDGANEWYVTDAVVDWTVSDPESVVVINSGCVDTTINYDTTGVTLSCTAHSVGGSAGPVTVTIKRDATNPEVSLVGGPVDGESYYFGFVPAAPTCTASDATSGLYGDCSVSGYSGTVGSHTVIASAKDMAGNTATDSATYEVLAWTLKGFYQPVDMNGVWNLIKGGQTVSLKFNIFAGPTELTDISYVDKFVVLGVTCPNASATTDNIELTTTGGTTLRYDVIGGQFIQNWQTPKMSNVCYSVTMYADDGSSLEAFFKLK